MELDKTGNIEWQNVQLTPHFSLFELCRSAKHPDLVEPPGALITNNLLWWARAALEPLRAIVGRLKVDSGFRNPRLNAAVGGEKHSIHQVMVNGVLVGVATDIVPLDIPLDELFRVIHLAKNLPIRGCIIYPYRGFIHIDSRMGEKPRFFVSPSKSVYNELSDDEIVNYRLPKGS